MISLNIIKHGLIQWDLEYPQPADKQIQLLSSSLKFEIGKVPDTDSFSSRKTKRYKTEEITDII